MLFKRMQKGEKQSPYFQVLRDRTVLDYQLQVQRLASRITLSQLKSTNDCATKDLVLPLAQPPHLSPSANLCEFEISPAAVWEDWLDDSGCKEKWCHRPGQGCLRPCQVKLKSFRDKTLLHYYVKYTHQSNFSQVWSVQLEWRLLHNQTIKVFPHQTEKVRHHSYTGEKVSV